MKYLPLLFAVLLAGCSPSQPVVTLPAVETPPLPIDPDAPAPKPMAAAAVRTKLASMITPPKTNVIKLTLNWQVSANARPMTNYTLLWGTNPAALSWASSFATTGRVWTVSVTNVVPTDEFDTNTVAIEHWFFRLRFDDAGAVLSEMARYPQWLPNRVRLAWNKQAQATVQTSDGLAPANWTALASLNGTNIDLPLGPGRQFFRVVTTSGQPLRATLRPYFQPAGDLGLDRAVTLAWGASPSPEVVGYQIWYGGAGLGYTNYVETAATNLIATVHGLGDGRAYQFAAVAFDIFGMTSDYSEDCGYLVPLASRIDVSGP